MSELEKIDQLFEDAKAQDPTISFSRFYMGVLVTKIQDGEPHPTLGPRMSSMLPWAEAGRDTFNTYRQALGITPQHRVVDYGCGSLRVGYHLMRLLDAGNYFGLELMSELLEMGKEQIGPTTRAEKLPILRCIEPGSLVEAESFGADAVISTTVAFHIHPDETAVYFGNLARIAAKPGCRVLFDAKIGDKAQRYNNRAWAWPLKYFEEALAPLKFIKVHHEKPYPAAGVGYTNGYFEFLRS